MQAMRFACVIVLLLAGLHGGAQAADAVELRRYPLAGRGVLFLEVPPGWHDSVQDSGTDPLPVLVFWVRHGDPFMASLKPLLLERTADSETAAMLRARIGQTLDSVRPQAEETDIDIVAFTGRSGPGFHFSATDIAPRPDSFKHMTRGVVQVGALTLEFTILTNTGRDAIVDAVLAMLRSAVFASPRDLP